MLDSTHNKIKIMAESLWNEPAVSLLNSPWDPFNGVLNFKVSGDYEYLENRPDFPDIKISFNLRNARRDGDIITAKLGNFTHKEVGAMKAAMYTALMAMTPSFRFGMSTVFRKDLADHIRVTFKHDKKDYVVKVNCAAVLQFWLTKARASFNHTANVEMWDKRFFDRASYWAYLAQHIEVKEVSDVYRR